MTGRFGSRWILLGAVAWVMGSGQTLRAADNPGSVPQRVIFDTDICGDCDDVLALAMLHALQSRGDCQLVAVTVSADNDLAGPMVDAINTFYGRGKIPVGVVRPHGPKFDSKYLPMVNQRDGGAFRYPHRLTSGADAPEAVSVLRKVLAAQPDGSVVVIQVGFSTNLARLLDSKPDDVCPLSGTELVQRKVKLLSLMAGAFQPIDGNSKFTEYNVAMDVPSAKTLAERWPTPRVWSGFEIGIALPYPATSILRDYAYAPHHPVAEAYVRYEPPPHNRPTWDLTSVLYAVQPDRGYFELSQPGTVTIQPDGSNTFAPKADGRDRYLILKPEVADRVTEALVQLSSQPPDRSAGR